MTAPRPGATDTRIRQVSILVVNWNAGPLLRRCVSSAIETGAEVVVVDNASNDGAALEVAAHLPAARVLLERENRGFAGGVNLAAHHAAGDYLLLLNPDARIDAAAVLALRDALDAHPDAGAAGACLVDEDGTPQRGFTVRRFPTLASIAADLLLVDDLWPGNPVRRRYLADDVPLDGRDPLDVEQPAAACLMLRRRVFDALGGLDERFHPAWFEDVDLCRRVRAAGHRILFVPAARVVHVGGVSLRSLDRSRFARIWYRNLRRYVSLHHGPPARWLVTWLIVAGMVLRAAAGLALRQKDRRDAALDVLRDLWQGERAGDRAR
ncbi:MAG: glycosyltransferase family 2 protein [Vicinamibacterales bacterium]|jgi:GT2 family glycosyltransferase|nr:glycosyltransferase family 2 protein [Vicinamibacterales bacterium]